LVELVSLIRIDSLPYSNNKFGTLFKEPRAQYCLQFASIVKFPIRIFSKAQS